MKSSAVAVHCKVAVVKVCNDNYTVLCNHGDFIDVAGILHGFTFNNL